jgi:TPR repeat protein
MTFEPTEDALAFGRIYALFYGNKPYGYVYSRGEDIGINFKEGVKQLRMLADKGYAPAIHQLAACYYDGQGVRKSFAEAFRLYEISANKGFAPSSGALAVFYSGPKYSGNIQALNMAKAFELNLLAARAGLAGSMVNLANQYRAGMGTTPSTYNAYVWATLAVRCTPPPMRDYMAENLAYEVAATLSEAELAAAEAEMTSLRQVMNPLFVAHPSYWRHFVDLANPST